MIQCKETEKKITKYVDVLFFKDEIVIFKHFSRKNHHFQAKLKIKHFLSTPLKFKRFSMPVSTLVATNYMYQKRFDNVHVSYAIYQLVCITWWYI